MTSWDINYGIEYIAGEVSLRDLRPACRSRSAPTATGSSSKLTEIAPDLDLLLVSLEGIGTTNDKIRKLGSYRSALSALEIAQQLGVRARPRP